MAKKNEKKMSPFEKEQYKLYNTKKNNKFYVILEVQVEKEGKRDTDFKLFKHTNLNEFVEIDQPAFPFSAYLYSFSEQKRDNTPTTINNMQKIMGKPFNTEVAENKYIWFIPNDISSKVFEKFPLVSNLYPFGSIMSFEIYNQLKNSKKKKKKEEEEKVKEEKFEDKKIETEETNKEDLLVDKISIDSFYSEFEFLDKTKIYLYINNLSDVTENINEDLKKRIGKKNVVPINKIKYLLKKRTNIQNFFIGLILFIISIILLGIGGVGSYIQSNLIIEKNRELKKFQKNLSEAKESLKKVKEEYQIVYDERIVGKSLSNIDLKDILSRLEILSSLSLKKSGSIAINKIPEKEENKIVISTDLEYYDSKKLPLLMKTLEKVFSDKKDIEIKQKYYLDGSFQLTISYKE